MYLTLISLQLTSFSFILLFGRWLGSRGTILLSISASIMTALISLLIFYEVVICRCPVFINLNIFFNVDLFDASWGLLFDSLSAVMIVVVTLISCLVVIYSTDYMLGDPHLIRFISYLMLFTVAMLLLVTADNYIQLFIGWESVGLASFLLISFWFTRLQAYKSAIQAMLFNRVGDLSLAIGIIYIYTIFKTTNYTVINACCTSLVSINLFSTDIYFTNLDLACLLLFIGAMGKSGQFLLHIWLPNAMNAPTPVSALLHAATMVTAGVFLLARSSHLLEHAQNASTIITIIGAITTIFAGTIGLVQNDFKSIIAYSTVSQLGYMVTVCGLSFSNVAIFHLWNHAFFKALLFLTAGAVIHSSNNQQDIRHFGGLQQIGIFNYCCLLIGTLSIVGLPFLTGFYSKDLIIELANSNFYITSHFGYNLTVLSVLITSFYSFRLLFYIFFSDQNKITNVNKSMIKYYHDASKNNVIVLTILSLGSIIAGFYFKSMFVSAGTDVWNNSIITSVNSNNLIEAEFLDNSIKLIPLFLTILGALFAYSFNQLNLLQISNITKNYNYNIYSMLSSRWFYDKLINESINNPSYNLGLTFVKIYEKGILELLPFTGIQLANNIKDLSKRLSVTQSGYIINYGSLLVSVTLISIYILNNDFIFNYILDLKFVILLLLILFY